MKKSFFVWGSNLMLYMVAVIGLIGLLNYLSTRHYFRFDLTEKGKYTLSDQTVKVLKNLKTEVKTIAFVKDEPSARRQVREALDGYRYHSEFFRWKFVDPDKYPLTAKKYGVLRYNSFVVEGSDGRKESFFGRLSEENLTNSIVKVSSDKVKKVYFTGGHGEKEIEGTKPRDYRQIALALENENFKPETLVLAKIKKIPDDASVIVVAGPAKDLFEGELKMIRDYLNGGGRALFLVDPMTLKTTIDFLAEYGIEPMDNVIVDKYSKTLGGDYLSPAVTSYNKEHPITKDFKYITIFPLARSLKPDGGNKNGRTVEILATTLKDSWGESSRKELASGRVAFNEKEDTYGPLIIAAVAEIEQKEKPKGRKGELVVIGDSDFAANSYIGFGGNRDFFLNIINWLAGEEDRISIRPKAAKMDPIIFSNNETYAVAGISIIGLPLIMLIIGVWVNVRRRRS